MLHCDLSIITRGGETFMSRCLGDFGIKAAEVKIVFTLLDRNMTVDGKVMQIDPSNGSVMPFVDRRRTLVPLRAIVENMSGKIGWDGNEKRIDLSLGPNTIQLWLDNMNAKVNGKQVTLEVPATSVEGRTMVPVRFVAENLGAKVDWNGDTRQVTISF